ncbi:alpha/beta hydrolase [Baekduia sp. Peel2402]|uniref:alpha/beta hydrolase n=1 Tax=Baekduia sp. Peel2402 TaxID=3458296 RepID=UPI00403E67F5
MKKLLLVVLVVLVLGAGGSTSARAADLTLLSSTQIDARLTELTFRSPSLADPVKVRVLVPREAASHPTARYPALYLLHGSGGTAAAWTQLDAEALTEGMGLVVVMPDGGDEGWYTNWPGLEPPRWEDFHVDELIPWIEAHKPVIAARSKRAVAGFSMGGFGAMSYAARHPDRFAAAASFSGALDLGTPAGSAPGLVDAQPWGPWSGPQIAWRGHNPYDLAGNLRGVGLQIYTGDGDGTDDVEPIVGAQSKSFAGRLGTLGIPRVFVDYGRGGHQGELFKRDLKQTLPGLMDRLTHPVDLPSRWSFRATEREWTMRGYTLSARRDALSWRALEDVRASGLTVRTDGPVTVTTSRRYAHDARYRVVVRPRGAKTRRLVVRASANGRLVFDVPRTSTVEITRAAASTG